MLSGGAIVPTRRWYGLISFKWTDGEWNYGKELGNVEISVNDTKGTESQLKILESHEANRMLGVFLAIDGNNKVQIQHMRKVAETWYKK